MSAAVLPPPFETVLPPRKKFTSDEVQRMRDSGIFAGQRFELIDGDLIDKMGQNPPHVRVIQLLTALLISLFGPDRPRFQADIDAATPDRERNKPEPDAVVLVEWKSDYLSRHPRGNELTLAVEVSDTSLPTDLTVKRGLYARAGVPEYWVIDVNDRRVIVHRTPVEGDYSEVRSLGESDSIALGTHLIEVAKLLP